MTASENLDQGERAWLGEAVKLANIPTLAAMLIQMTGDLKWIEGRFVPTRTRGLDDNDDGGLPDAVQDEIRAAALNELRAWFAGKQPAIPNPDDALLLRIMSVSLGEQIPAEYAPLVRNELQLPDPAGADQPFPASPPGFRALIVGAGISGICAAAKFEEAGIDYVIVERGSAMGGVWQDNRYPGAACDVPSYLYSFSFASYPWSRYFADSREIHRYLEKVASDLDIIRHVRFGVNVREVRYDEARRMWDADVMNEAGEAETLTASIVVSAVGAFNKPRIPNLPGLESFEGPSVHTAQYPDAGLDLAGKHVVLIGSGASAMQVAPAIADEVATLTIVQRTAQWAAPHPKFKVEVPEPVQKLLEEVPVYRLWYRLRLSWAFNDKLYEALQNDPAYAEDPLAINPINDAHRRGLTSYIESELGDSPHLLPQVLPDYPPFAKRMLLDNGWFRSLTKPNVRLVTGSVSSVAEHSITTDGGETIDADVLIWATGFDVVNWLIPMRVKGIGGRDIHDDWEGDNARAYLGTVVPGYPNFFLFYGPNTQFGHGGSLITVLERQVHYLMSLLGQMFAEGIDSVDVRNDRYEEYNAMIDSRHADMVWTSTGVKTYFHNSKGRVIVNNPFRILEVWKMTEHANLDDFEIVHHATAEQ
ncbi:NAD(P)/FAD-dependent oxidoreductase [Croceicoccus ponticola]|uniref:NAD(P)/FAD-dependent oxidoreductase n=1 Tax=Croceicoccus ponticola TaxID=2217664 RepID=A0A437GUD3_9SPHN|nr:NAD(P)/FAD-dependent oxidoreductase [Croceicoccus ponticola]RVQ65020.1 NAD(P)/FAD-dependent oxidoreductase [Croceicoccus ponticola]